jgi:hypothetical protein
MRFKYCVDNHTAFSSLSEFLCAHKVKQPPRGFLMDELMLTTQTMLRSEYPPSLSQHLYMHIYRTLPGSG